MRGEELLEEQRDYVYSHLLLLALHAPVVLVALVPLETSPGVDRGVELGRLAFLVRVFYIWRAWGCVCNNFSKSELQFKYFILTVKPMAMFDSKPLIAPAFDVQETHRLFATAGAPAYHVGWLLRSEQVRTGAPLELYSLIVSRLGKGPTGSRWRAS